jgi:hypothetical protein
VPSGSHRLSHGHDLPTVRTHRWMPRLTRASPAICAQRLADLERKLEKHRGEAENAFVVVESAYSMSGDLSPLREIAALKERYNFFLHVDEAHTFGFYGEGGRGYCNALVVTNQVDFIMSTLSKATASLGGFVAADSKYCTMLTCTAGRDGDETACTGVERYSRASSKRGRSPVQPRDRGHAPPAAPLAARDLS